MALVTPMKEDYSVDFNSLEKLVELHVESGTAAIIAAGTTGESATLSVEEHINLAKFIVDKTRGRIKVGVGTGANSTTEAIELHSKARDIGADFALSVVPYYNKPTQEGLFKHYETIIKAVDIPLILYNVPGRTVADLENRTALELSKIPNIIGIKDATGNLWRNQELIKKTGEDFAVYSGDDPTFMPFMLVGGDGVISVTANVRPKSIAKICDLVFKGEYDKALEINRKLLDLHHLLFIQSNPIPVKYCLFKMGLIKNVLRLPLTTLDPKFYSVLDGALNESDEVEV